MNAVPSLSVSKPASALVKEQICQAVVKASQRHFGDRRQAVLLTGSLARNEATIQFDASGCKVLGDAEFVLILSELPQRRALAGCIAEAEANCAAKQIFCKIDCSGVKPDYFRSLRPSIYSYELLQSAIICAGDDKIFRATPRFSPEAIPREDAWRMLCNRLIELLEVLPEDLRTAPNAGVDYRTIKLNLDLATSILVFVGSYQASYSDRARAFRENLDDMPEIPGIDLVAFAGGLEAATNAKLGKAQVPHVDQGQAQASIRQALAVCAWELQQLNDTAAGENCETLMQRWMRRVSLRSRLRGWAYVAREQGWFSSWKQWGRWSRMALTASPRYWIYAAALQAGQRFVSGASDVGSSDKCELPLRAVNLDSQAACRQAIVRNYRECVVGTTA